MKEPLALARRREIYEAIRKSPGIQFSEIQERFSVPTGVLQHHLRVLEKMELICVQLAGARKQFFVKNCIPLNDRTALSAIRLKSQRDIILILLKKGRLSFGELAKYVPFGRSTLSFHMRKLAASHLIDVERVGKQKFYRIADREHVLRVLIMYKEGILDDAVDNFVQTWTDM